MSDHNTSIDLLPFPLIPETPVNVTTAIDLIRFELDSVRASCKEAQTGTTERLEKIEKSVSNLETVFMKEIKELTAELRQIKESQIKLNNNNQAARIQAVDTKPKETGLATHPQIQLHASLGAFVPNYYDDDGFNSGINSGLNSDFISDFMIPE
jgi:hypothetical protein